MTETNKYTALTKSFQEAKILCRKYSEARVKLFLVIFDYIFPTTNRLWADADKMLDIHKQHKASKMI